MKLAGWPDRAGQALTGKVRPAGLVRVRVEGDIDIDMRIGMDMDIDVDIDRYVHTNGALSAPRSVRTREAPARSGDAGYPGSQAAPGRTESRCRRPMGQLRSSRTCLS